MPGSDDKFMKNDNIRILLSTIKQKRYKDIIISSCHDTFCA